MNRSITTVVLALLLSAGATLTACGSDEVGKSSGDTGAATSKETTPKQTPQEETPKPTPSEEGSDSLFNDGRKDVTIKSCAIKDLYGLGDSTAVADLKIENSSGKVSDYLIEIEVTDPQTGDRMETLLASATKVAPRQTVDTGNGDGEEDASGTDSQVTGPIKCTLLAADRTASVE